MNISSIKRFIKFGIVGGSGVFVNQGIFMALGHFAGFPVELASPVAIVIAIGTNFILNYHWTWGDRVGGNLKHLFKGYLKFFSASSTTAFLFNYLPLLFMVNYLGWPKDISNLVGILCASTINFLISHFWTFRLKKG